MTKKEKSIKAQELGKKSFTKGITAIPVHDKKLMKMIPENSPVGSSNYLFKAWLKGWTLENLK